MRTWAQEKKNDYKQERLSTYRKQSQQPCTYLHVEAIAFHSHAFPSVLIWMFLFIFVLELEEIHHKDFLL